MMQCYFSFFGWRKQLNVLSPAIEVIYNIGTGHVGTGRGLFLQYNPTIAGLYCKFAESNSYRIFLEKFVQLIINSTIATTKLLL